MEAASIRFDRSAPASKSIQNVRLLESGYSVTDQRISELPSDGKLKAYCYVNPSDIDMIKTGQQVSFQIDGFDSNTWGMLAGKVVEISEDLVLHGNDPPVFKVQCSLDKDHFDLNDAKVYLKKGMSFTARFNVGDRNLFQLLWSKSDRSRDPDIQKERQN